MSRTRFTLAAPSLRRVVAALGIASLALIAAPATAGAADEVATINTYSVWNGVDFVFPFGHPNTTTYGQTITVPAGLTKIQRFSFYLAENSGGGTQILRGEVYAWDGDSATGSAVWESAPRTITLDATYQKVGMRPRCAPVTPGGQYVLFLSVSKDYEETPPNTLSQWAANYTDVYAGGNVVYLNDAGDESQWTAGTWSAISTFDFAMKAKLNP